MSILTLTEDNYDKVISNGRVLVDFWAAWCTPCRLVAPIIDELAAEYEGSLLVAKVDVENESTLASRNDIQNIPTVILFQNGKEISRIIGAQKKGVYQAELGVRG